MQGLVSSRSASSDYSTVTAASQQLASMAVGQIYRLVSSIDTWVAVGSNPTAAAADGSHFLAAGREMYISCIADADKVAVLRVGSSDGVCTLSVLHSA
jgi:uncharacterized protein (DUF2345 family)